MRLDPEKVNMLLGTMPIKLIDGTIENFAIKSDLKNMKASISIQAIHLKVYLDDHSQYQRYKQSNMPEYMVLSAHQDQRYNETEGDNTSKDQSCLNNLLSSFELGFTLDKLTLEIKTEKEMFDSSSLYIEMNNLKLCKPKQKNLMILQSFFVSLHSVEVDIKEMCSRRTKLLSMRRIRHHEQPVKCEDFLQLSAEIFKTDQSGKKKVSVRGDIGSIQSIASISNILTFMSMGEKMGNYVNRQKFMNEDLFKVIDNILSYEEEQLSNFNLGQRPNDAPADDEMFHSVIDNYRSNVFTSVTQSLIGGNHAAAAIQETEPTIDIENLKDQVKDSQFDVEIDFQGVYLGILKESSFETSEYFAWVDIVGIKNLQFTEVIGSYILVSLEKIQLIHNDIGSNYCLTLSQLRIDDCVYIDISSNKEDSFANRVSIGGIDPDMSMTNETFHSFIDTSLKYETFNLLKIEDRTNVVVKYDIKEVLKLKIEVSVILVNIDIKAFTLMKNRKGFYDDIISTFKQLDTIHKKIAADQVKYSLKYYDGMDSKSISDICKRVKLLADQVDDPKIKSRLKRLLDIQDSSVLSAAESPKIEIVLKGFQVKAGGVLDERTSQVSYISIHANNINILLNKQIIISWKNTIDLKIEDMREQRLIASIVGDKENVIGIDLKKMIIKITGIDINFSPQIFEKLLVFIELLSSRMNKVEMGSNKFKLLKRIEELKQKRSRAYLLFDEELVINETLQKVSLTLLEVPPLVEKVYFYLGKISLRVYDEELTKEIIESSIALHKRIYEDADDWIVIETDGMTNLKASMEEDIKKRQTLLNDLKSILHLELKPIMMVLGLKSNNDFKLMIHTILLRDGITDSYFEKNKHDYKTVFCEVYSINYNQPVYDAKLKGTFQIHQALDSFNTILKEFKSKGAFLEVNQKTKQDPHSNNSKVEISVKMSSFVVRFAMQTPTETFVCFIKLIDSTLERLEALKELVIKLQEQEEAEVQDFRKQKVQMEKIKKSVIEPVKQDSRISVQLDKIYFDIFHESKYRILLEINRSNADIISDAHKPSVITADLDQIRLSFTSDKDCCLEKSVDLFSNKNQKYFSLLKLKLVRLLMSTVPAASSSHVEKTFISIALPQVNHNNLIVRFDIESLTVLLDLTTRFDSLMQSSKKKTRVIFKDNNQYLHKKSQLLEDEEEFMTVGLKLEESKNLRKLIDEISCLSHVKPSDEEGSKKTSKEKKLMAAQQLLKECHVQYLPMNRRETHVDLQVDKITVNLFQTFDIEGPSYISLGIIDLLVATKITDSSEPIRDGERTSSMLQTFISLKHFRIIDKTKSSMFKYLVNIPKHSLNVYLRIRTTTDKKPQDKHSSKFLFECNQM